jgi:hypothetical protein
VLGTCVYKTRVPTLRVRLFVLRIFLCLFLGGDIRCCWVYLHKAVVKRTAEAMFSRKWRKSCASGNSGSDILGKMALFLKCIQARAQVQVQTQAHKRSF